MKHGLLSRSGSYLMGGSLPIWVLTLLLGLGMTTSLQASAFFCPIQPNASNSAATCFLGSDGSASVNPSGGAAPYSVSWSNGGSGNSITGLSAGNYQYTITDSEGCSVSSNIYVGQASSIQANVSRINNGCRFDTQGELSLAPSGGTPPYSYAWSNGATSATISGLAAGPYAYTITDANGCTRSGGVSVLASTPVIGNATARDVNCHGEAEGSATLSPSGGVGPYTYQWSNGATTQDVSGLAAGNYSYTVTDSQGCTGEGSLAIQQPAPVWTTFEQTYACGDEDNGSAEVFANGGTPPYTYQWSNGATTAAITNLPPGMYFYTVTDSEGCESREGLVCIFRSIIEASATANAPDCSSADDGSASIVVTDGIAPITYQWSNGATTPTVSGLAPGTYGYTVTGAFGCDVSGSITIAEANINVVASVTELVNGNLQASGSGGAAPYTYEWSNGETTAIASDYTEGTYSVTVTDANGCFGIISGLVPGDDDPCPDNVTYPGMIGFDQELCAPGNTPEQLVETDAPSGGSGSLEFLWLSNTTGGPLDNTWLEIPNSNSPNYQPGPLDVTTYYLRCVRTDNESCPFLETQLVIVSVGDEIDPVIERPSLGCFGQTQTYRATNLPPFADVSWEFSGPVTVNTTTGDEVEVTFIGGGYLDYTVTVSTDDCTGSFSDRVTINGNCVGGTPSHNFSSVEHDVLAAYPNPASALTTLDFGVELSANAQVQVLSNTQQVLATYTVAAGTRRFDLNMSELPAGMYTVQVVDGNEQPRVLKLMKN
ncbi:MAG: T9SS type A sorting domain-containing protein [Bacteroidota bacterium]